MEGTQENCWRNLLEFDWSERRDTRSLPTHKVQHHSIMAIVDETIRERRLRMLRPLSLACEGCSMCELGLQPAKRGDIVRDPHVFSNMSPSRVMVVGQNPGWDELAAREPFVGAAGRNFDAEIAKHGMSRTDFYICNAVRCFTADNQRPSDRHKDRCEPFLRMEMNLLKPKLVVALGAVAFAQLCPGAEFADGLRQITRSTRYDVPVFGIYHPSPLNLQQSARRKAFAEQIAILCGLVARLTAADADQSVNA